MQKSKPSTHKPPSELQVATTQYNGIRWQLKGTAAVVKNLERRVPVQGLLISPPGTPWPEYPRQLRDKLCIALAEAQNQLEYCEYLARMLSQAHSEAYAHTKALGKASEVDE